MFKERITAIMKHFGLNYEGFAEKADLNSHTVGRWLNHNVKARKDSLEKIEKTFGINPIWLETGNSEMFVKDNTTADIDNIINWLKGLNAEKRFG